MSRLLLTTEEFFDKYFEIDNKSKLPNQDILAVLEQTPNIILSQLTFGKWLKQQGFKQVRIMIDGHKHHGWWGFKVKSKEL